MRLARGAARMEGRAHGVLWRFPLLSEALERLSSLASRQEAAEAQLEARQMIEACSLRREPLGVDRHKRRYWRFPADGERLYVEWRAPPGAPPPPLSAKPPLDVASPVPVPSPGGGEVEGKRARTSSTKAMGRVSASLAKGARKQSKQEVAAAAAAAAAAEAAETEARLAAAQRPSTAPSTWRCYRSREEVRQLVASLDDRGISEGALKRTLQAEIDIFMTEMPAEPLPPPPSAADGWLSRGPHVGERVLFVFPNLGESEGRISHYMPADGEDPALWHVVHDDGDEEDLEGYELDAARRRWRERPADGLQDHIGPFAGWANTALPPKQRASRRALTAGGAARAEMVSLLDDAARGMVAAGVAWAAAAAAARDRSDKANKGGADKADADKVDADAPAADAATWRSAVELAAEVPTAGRRLLELESRLRQMQTVADVSRAPEESGEEEEGEEEEEPAEDADTAEGAAEEEPAANGAEAKPAAEVKPKAKGGSRRGGKAPEEAEPVAGAKRTANGAMREPGGAGGLGGMGDSRLWPDVQAREKWKGFVSAAATFPQLALATASLRDHAAAFGALGKRVDASARSVAEQRCEEVWDA